MSDFVKELINLSTLSTYYADDLNINLAVEGGKIVGLFERNVDIEKYIKVVKNGIIARHCGNKERVANKFFNLDSFPFKVDVERDVRDKNGRVQELVIGVDDRTILNFKVLAAMEFQEAVDGSIMSLEKRDEQKTEEEVNAYVRNTVMLNKTDKSDYLYYISFNNKYLEEVAKEKIKKDCQISEKEFEELFGEGRALRTDFVDIVEAVCKKFKEVYVAAYESRAKLCSLNGSVLYEEQDNKLYIKDITNISVVKSISQYVAGRIALDFRTPGKKDSKVENCKNVLSDLIFESQAKFNKFPCRIDGYDYDAFTDEKKKMGGYHFALMPKIQVSDMEVRDITKEEADRINAAFRKKGFGDILIEIKGKIEKTEFTDSEEQVYGITNKELGRLILELMKSPIGYNESGRFEYAINLGNLYKSREHFHLKEDLLRIIPYNFMVYDRLLKCLSKSGFGLDGYDVPELVQFVDKKFVEKKMEERGIPEQKTIEKRKEHLHCKKRFNAQPNPAHQRVAPSYLSAPHAPYNRRDSIGSICSIGSIGSTGSSAASSVGSSSPKKLFPTNSSGSSLSHGLLSPVNSVNELKSHDISPSTPVEGSFDIAPGNNTKPVVHNIPPIKVTEVEDKDSKSSSGPYFLQLKRHKAAHDTQIKDVGSSSVQSNPPSSNMSSIQNQEHIRVPIIPDPKDQNKKESNKDKKKSTHAAKLEAKRTQATTKSSKCVIL